MKYLSHFTLRAFVVIGLSLGCVKAQMKKEEVMAFFKGVDINKVETISELVGSYETQGTFPKILQSYEKLYSKVGKMGPLKVVFYENSLVITDSTKATLFPYQKIKRLHHYKNKKNGKESLTITQ
ncbi:hypothetical protein OAG67_01075 [bacterium]|nr:hypothetical protein [bacterium]|tara:strand:- start:64 stop:438 length:375 start_codon:yes stop_codon:yes gene_type:complete